MPRRIWSDIKCPRLYEDEHFMQLLLWKIAGKYKISPAVVKGDSQSQKAAIPRAEFVVRAVRHGITRQAIGDFLGGRHNSTITGIYHDHKHNYEKN